LATLLTWHRNDPPDDFEMNRNNIIYNWQRNRNPFIDQPDLVEYIWGTNIGDVWMNTLSVSQSEEIIISLFPNPATTNLYVKGIRSRGKLEVFNALGSTVLETYIEAGKAVSVSDLQSGFYLAKIVSNDAVFVKRIVIK